MQTTRQHICRNKKGELQRVLNAELNSIAGLGKTKISTQCSKHQVHVIYVLGAIIHGKYMYNVFTLNCIHVDICISLSYRLCEHMYVYMLSKCYMY